MQRRRGRSHLGAGTLNQSLGPEAPGESYQNKPCLYQEQLFIHCIKQVFEAQFRRFQRLLPTGIAIMTRGRHIQVQTWILKTRSLPLSELQN